VSSSSIEDIAEDAHYRVTSIDLDDLNGRAGAHSWGYVGPDQGAQDLLEEALEDLVEDMKRRADLGLVSATEVVCAGIVQGLYQARPSLLRLIRKGGKPLGFPGGKLLER
jgi:hypothetical protein